MKILMRFWEDRRGATAIEYALIGSIISIAVLGAAMTIGGELIATFNDVAAGF